MQDCFALSSFLLGGVIGDFNGDGWGGGLRSSFFPPPFYTKLSFSFFTLFLHWSQMLSKKKKD